MKFSIETEKLKKGLDIVNHATANISTTPILENILIKVNENNTNKTHRGIGIHRRCKSGKNWKLLFAK